ncbi:hypothetical protein [Actinophytocola oryzae]|uniref:PPE family protein n=1 Tax=Actinophytocola oryzae TaxID=502181 RepID=A0A4R7UW26_9PSEU|nr:hypothetical protein [Actinophytocola oryzae]TDV40700.1 hypothetical protein CLV71_12290 [Actinophytocola oryzae]
MAPNNEHHHHHYDTNRYAGDQAADNRRVMNHMPSEDRVPTQDIQQSINAQQAADLSHGVRMGDDRVIGDTPNWDAYDSEQLYRFATENNSPYTADDLGRSFNDGGNSLAEAANGLFDAVTRLDGAWTGVAAESATGALAPLAQAAGIAGQTAQLMGVRMSQQSVAASEVRKLPPPKKFDQQQSLHAMVAGGPAAMQADLKTQKDAADAVKKEQISYLNTYTSSMSIVDAQTPSFVPPEETIGGGNGNGNSITGERVFIPQTGGPVPNPGGSTDTGTPRNPNTGFTGPNGDQPGFVSGDGNGPTDQSGFTPGLTTGSSAFTPPTNSPTPNTFGPGGGTPGAPGGGVPGAGSGGFGPGFGGFGTPGGTGGFGAGGGPGAGAGGPGAGSGNPAARPVAGGMGGAGGAGGRGGSGAGGAPRGKGEGEEDKEHTRPSYLVEGDPESTFGSDELTAPPVIGGDD